jgi:DNA-directed RNA polymerase I subunit RPA1
VVNLKFKSLDERTALANQLLAPSNWRLKGTRNKKVYRHLTTGDYVLMNRYAIKIPWLRAMFNI